MRCFCFKSYQMRTHAITLATTSIQQFFKEQIKNKKRDREKIEVGEQRKATKNTN